MDAEVKRRGELAWAATVALICAHFTLVYNQRALPFLKYDEYANGTAMLPYQARVLMSWVLRRGAGLRAVQSVPTHFHNFVRDPYEVVLMATTFIGLLVALLATRFTIGRLTGKPVFARWASLLVIWMAYFNLATPYGLTYSLPYDVSSLAFFAVGVALVVAERAIWLPLLVAVATLNRETICFVSLFYAIWEWKRLQSLSTRDRLLRIAPLLVVQAAIWIGIKVWLQHHFAGNPTEGQGSGLFQNVLLRNLRFIANPLQWPLLASICGFLWIAVIAQRRWIRHNGLQTACIVILPLWAAVMLCVGVVIEIRVFNELSAILAPAAALIVYHRWSRPSSTSTREQTES